MFIHIYKYRLQKLFRDKQILFWTMIFPLLMCTFFYLCFGNYMKRAEVFIKIPVAYVSDGQYTMENSFQEFLNELVSEDNNGYLVIHPSSASEASSLLEAGDIDGIIYVDETIHLTVASQGIEQSILKTLLDSYLQVEGAIRQTMETNPEKVPVMLEVLAASHRYTAETVLGAENQDSMLQYFYALMAMTCLYSCFFGLANANDIQANLTSLGARRGVAPVHKLKISLAEFLAAVTLQMGIILLLLFYMTGILGISFGSQFPLILLTCLVGSMLGVAYGTFIGAVFKGGTGSKSSEGVKAAILTGSTLAMCFMAGLMFGTMKHIVERTMPILNRINPAVLLTDAFYALNIYDTYTRFLTNLGILLIMTALLLIGNFLIMRRSKYASL